MTDRPLALAPQRLVSQTLRTLRRIARQLERRLRYRRLGWV